MRELSNSIESIAYDINNRGIVVGEMETYDAARKPYFAAFIWSASDGMHELSTPAGAFSKAWSINDRGQVVGILLEDGGRDYQYNAVMWDNGELIDLNSFLPTNSGWILLEATDINEAGQIVGAGLINGEQHAFLLTPHNVPEPSTLFLLGAGFAGLAFARTRMRR